jgi:hypothetical protein
MTNIQLFLSIGIPTLAVLIGFLMNNARLSTIEARIGSVESNLGARIGGVESRLTAIEGDLRQFYRNLGAHEAEIANLKTRRPA